VGGPAEAGAIPQMAVEANMSAAALHAFEPWEASPTGWPVQRPCLAALKDLGLSDGQIARYFRVRPEEAAALRVSYGIADQSQPSGEAPPRRRRFALRRRA
jgi:hypothetical protein